jgi:hypothetical protein
MVNELMRGALIARQCVTDHLTSSLPDFIAAARTQWNVSEWRLPTPSKFDSYDPLYAQDYPTVGALITRSNNFRRLDMNEAGEDVYQVRYSVQVFVWCMTPQDDDDVWTSPPHETAMEVRDDMLNLIRTCILTKKSLGRPAVCSVVEGTMTEDYLEGFKLSDQGPPWVAGGTVSFDLDIIEANYVPAIGTAETVDTDVTTME